LPADFVPLLDLASAIAILSLAGQVAVRAVRTAEALPLLVAAVCVLSLALVDMAGLHRVIAEAGAALAGSAEIGKALGLATLAVLFAAAAIVLWGLHKSLGQQRGPAAVLLAWLATIGAAHLATGGLVRLLGGGRGWNALEEMVEIAASVAAIYLVGGPAPAQPAGSAEPQSATALRS
jgi:hypothetical protein